MISLRNQWSIFLIALGFLTRIPIGNVDFSPEKLNKASRYFALVGALIGLLCAAVFLTAHLVLSQEIAILLSMVVGFYLTGGFHEDGLADVCDGFGGGYTKIRKLEIMKDSRVGTYGSLGLFSALLLKFLLLNELADPAIALILMHTLSRTLASSIIFSAHYASADLISKTKPLAISMSLTSLLILLISTALILALSTFVYLTISNLVILILILVVLRSILIKWFEHHLDGYTGDCLGFAQQTSELLGYLTLIILLGTPDVR